MARSLNKVILIGHIGRDAETTFTPSGTAVTKFSLATSRNWKDKQSGEWKEETDWHNIVLWQQEKVGEYLKKGKQVCVEGRIQTRSWEKDGVKHYATDIVAENVLLLGSANGGNGAAASAPAKPAAKPALTDDDVPF